MQHMQAMNADLKVDAMEVRPVLGGKLSCLRMEGVEVGGCHRLRQKAVHRTQRSSTPIVEQTRSPRCWTGYRRYL